jgi:hypothetical protein
MDKKLGSSKSTDDYGNAAKLTLEGSSARQTKAQSKAQSHHYNNKNYLTSRVTIPPEILETCNKHGFRFTTLYPSISTDNAPELFQRHNVDQVKETRELTLFSVPEQETATKETAKADTRQNNRSQKSTGEFLE